jgi:hypothetical protein
LILISIGAVFVGVPGGQQLLHYILYSDPLQIAATLLLLLCVFLAPLGPVSLRRSQVPGSERQKPSPPPDANVEDPPSDARDGAVVRVDPGSAPTRAPANRSHRQLTPIMASRATLSAPASASMSAQVEMPSVLDGHLLEGRVIDG